MKTICLLICLAVLIACDANSDANSEAVTATDTNAALTSPDPHNDGADLQSIATPEAYLATAVLAAPEASRAGARVIGYDAAGELVTLREGTNEFICLADDPDKDGFSAACYHESLEPFMARGRELRAEGKSNQEIDAMREQEVESGQLTMGDTGSTLHVYSGPEARYDPATGEVAGASYRYVVYMPFATAASTGLPESPIAPNHPWIMDPGTYRAHIMISPAQ